MGSRGDVSHVGELKGLTGDDVLRDLDDVRLLAELRRVVVFILGKRKTNKRGRTHIEEPRKSRTGSETMQKPRR